jgi:hypothetical protein
MKIIFPKEVYISCYRYEIIQDPNDGGGSFSTKANQIIIGTRDLDKDPHYVWNVICHEIFEATFGVMRYRYADPSSEDNWKFFMDHKEFENAIAVASLALAQFQIIHEDDTPAEEVVEKAD